MCSVVLVSSFHFFCICLFSRFLDGRAIPQYREWSSFGNCHVGFPSVCKISFVQCRNMFGNAVFLDFFMPRRCCACCWSGVTRSIQSCRACVCGFVVVLFHVECCLIIVVASCEVTRHYVSVRRLDCNHPCGSAASGNVGPVLPRFLLHRDMHLYAG